MENPDETESSVQKRSLQLLYALNIVATALQNSIQNEESIYAVFRQQTIALGLRGGISLLDESEKNLKFKTVAFTNTLRGILKPFETSLKTSVEGYSIPVDRVDVYQRVIRKSESVFMPDTSSITAQVVPTQVKGLVHTLLTVLGRPPGIFTPLIYNGKVSGMLNIVGPNLTQNDIPTMQAFANQIAVALENTRLIQKLQSTNEELQRKVAELERFTYTISHELKNPVITIKGYLGSIEKDLQNNNYERAQRDIARISAASDKLNDTISDLLDLSRIGRIVNPPEKVDLVTLVHEALETLQGRLLSSNIVVQISPDMPVICGDRLRLREAYENLIDNAAKNMGNQPAPLIEIGARMGDEMILFIKDNGIGIDPKYHTRIFGLFEKLDATSDGTGIGLALVKRIVETHGGKIWVESAGLGMGSTFCFTIPDRNN